MSEHMNYNKRIAVIGGGPAGMMAAGTATELGADVTIFEHTDRLGKKLAITGKGRCNVTNRCSVNEFMENVPKDSDMENFERCYNNLIDHICPKGSQPIFTSTVWKSDVKNALTQKIAEERNAPVVDLLEIGRNDDMMAIGLFEHHGVSIHPGDKGMQYIADEIYKVLKNYL